MIPVNFAAVSSQTRDLNRPVVENRAKLVSYSQMVNNDINSLKRFPENALQGIKTQKLSDYQLAKLDDASKFFSVLGIAALLSSSPKLKTGSIPYWLGGIGWLGAMTLYPAILKKLTKMKTGVPLEANYKSSEGEIKPLFDDPDYMPLQVLPKKKYNELLTRFGIPANALSRDERLQSKLKQISTQTHTWWMLTAGLSTPLMSSLFCDVLEKPVRRFLTHRVHAGLTYAGLQSAIKNGNRPLALKHLKDWIALNVSTKDYSKASLWWQTWTDGILNQLGLNNSKALRMLHIETPIKSLQSHRLYIYLSDKLKSLGTREGLETYLKAQQTEVTKIIDPVIQLLNSKEIKNIISIDDRKTLMQEVKLARGRATGTINHFLNTIDVFEKYQKQAPQVLRSHLKAVMEKPNLSFVVQNLKEGNLHRVKELTGPYFERVLKLINKQHFLPAHDIMGEVPKELLLRSMTSKLRRADWMKWFPQRLGIGLAITTLLFTSLAVGQNPLGNTLDEGQV